MELPFSVVVGVVAAVIIILIIIALAFFVKDAGQQAIQSIWNIGDYIKQLLGLKSGG